MQRNGNTNPTPDRNDWRNLHFTPGTAAVIAAIVMCVALLIAGMDPLVNPLLFAGVIGGAGIVSLLLKRRARNAAMRSTHDRS